MKKRILSFCLLLAMVVTALPLAAMTVLAAGASPVYEEEDYNSLYVQKDLLIAFDFFNTNATWGETASGNLADYVWTEAKSFSGTAEEGAIKDGYYNLNLGTSTLSASISSISNRGIGGLTAEFIGNFAGGANVPAPNNLRGGTWSSDKIVYTGIGFNNAAQSKIRTGDGKVVAFSVPAPAGVVSTLTYSMDVPAFTQNYYQYAPSNMNWEGHEGLNGWQNNYSVHYTYDAENDCVRMVVRYDLSNAIADYVYNAETQSYDYVGGKGDYAYNKNDKVYNYVGGNGDYTYNAETGEYTEVEAGKGDYAYNAETAKYDYVGLKGNYTYDKDADKYVYVGSNGYYACDEKGVYFLVNNGDYVRDEENDVYTYVGGNGDYTYNAETGEYTKVEEGKGDYVRDEENDKYAEVGGNGNYTYNAETGEYTEVEAGKGDYTFDAETGEYTEVGLKGNYTYNAETGEYTEVEAGKGNYDRIKTYRFVGLKGDYVSTTQKKSYAYFDYHPVVKTTKRIWDPTLNGGAGGVAETDTEKNYVVDALPRDGGNGTLTDFATESYGVGGTGFYASTPGFLGVYANGVAAYESDDVYFTANGHTNMTGSTFFRLWNKVNSKIYAFRQYNHILSATEMAQNHMADIAKFFKIDIGYIRLLNEASLLDLYDYAATLTFEDAEAGAKLETKAYELAVALYAGKLTPASLKVIADEGINITGIRLFPDEYANVIFAALEDYIPGKVAAEIQAFIDFKVTETLDTYYGKYIDKTVYDYKDLYVRQDDLTLAVDFFDAKPTDEPLYVGPTYPTWKAQYDAAQVMGLGYWKELKDAEDNLLYQTDESGRVLDTSPVKNIAEALQWVYDHDDSGNKYKYNNTRGYWMNLVDADGNELYVTAKTADGKWAPIETSTVKTLAEARKWLTANKEVVYQESNWDQFFEKYVWKGDSGFSALDISDTSGYYAHNNIRTFGEGCLITGMNNSFSVRYAYDAGDVTYQMVTKMGGNPNWQLRGFRVSFSGATAKTLKFTGLQYNGYNVTGKEDSPSASKIALLNIPLSNQVASVYSTDVTAVARRYSDVGGHYFKYEWNPNKKDSYGNPAPGYDVVELPSEEGSNSGKVSFFGLIDLDIYANGTRVCGMAGKPYNGGAPDSVGNAGSNEFYAIRVYRVALTPEEIAQNHFADLAGYYDLDLSLYYRLSDEDRAVLHNKLRTIELGSPAADAVALYEKTFADLYYIFATDSDASETFAEFAAKYKLKVENLTPLSPPAQERIFAHFTTDEMLTRESVAPVLQDALEKEILNLKTNHYAEAYVHTLSIFQGYQLTKKGDAGFRTLFTLDEKALQSIRAMYPTAAIEIGTLLVPAALADDANLVTLDADGVAIHEDVIEKVVAYENGNYTESVFDYRGVSAYACEYFPTDINEKVSFVNYVAIEISADEKVLYTAKANTSPISEGGLSLLELMRYAKETEGMAYENIQDKMNGVTGRYDAVLSVGNGNICDYVIVKNDWNATGVDQIAALIREYVGIDMRIVTEAEAAAYERCLYVGRNCDVKYEDVDLYGLNASPYTLSVWYFTEDNCEAAVELLAEILSFARDEGSYTLETGTDYVRRAR